jgi:hypothetical protein
MGSAVSGAPLSESLSLGERLDLLGRSAIDIEPQPLEVRRIISDPRHEPQQPQRINRNLKRNFLDIEVPVTILGSKSRKQVLEGMMLEDNGHKRCYPEDQLCFFRPTILTIVLDCSRYLVETLSDRLMSVESDPIHYCLRYISSYNGNTAHGITFSDGFAAAMTRIMEHPATKEMMEDKKFILPSNGK